MAGTSETEMVSRRPSPGCSRELMLNSAYEGNAVTRGSEGRIRSLEQCVESGGRARPPSPAVHKLILGGRIAAVLVVGALVT
jgi:hypothetical protein